MTPPRSSSRVACLCVAFVAAALFTSCSLFGDDERFEDRGVIATETGDAIVIENRRRTPIWTMLIAQNTLASLFLAPPSFRGDSIPPGNIRSTPLDSIFGLNVSGRDNGGNITVFWWEADYRDGERVPPDDYNTFVIER